MYVLNFTALWCGSGRLSKSLISINNTKKLNMKNNNNSIRFSTLSLLIPFGILLSYLSSDIYQVYLGYNICGIGEILF
jgi:hypothetical protein